MIRGGVGRRSKGSAAVRLALGLLHLEGVEGIHGIVLLVAEHVVNPGQILVLLDLVNEGDLELGLLLLLLFLVRRLSELLVFYIILVVLRSLFICELIGSLNLCPFLCF